MTYNVEATAKQVLWNWIEEQNMEVCGEVKLENKKRIDLVAKSGQNYIGFELKELTKTVESLKREIKIINQILEYANSGYLDYLYICSPDDRIHFFKDLNPEFFLRDPIIRYNYPDQYQKFFGLCHLLPKVGVIRIDDKPEFLAPAGKLNRTKEPNVYIDNEDRIKHFIWSFFAHKALICDGVLPNPNGQELKIDLLIFEGSIYPLEIYENQDKFDLVGIEIKNSIKDKEEIKEIINQIIRYLDSFCMTKLYLAVPDKLVSKARGLLTQTYLSEDNKLQQIGLMAVDEFGRVTIVEPATKLKMKYDSILINYFGRNSNRTQKMIEIGWGDYIKLDNRHKYHSPFVINQDSIFRKAVKKLGKKEYLY